MRRSSGALDVDISIVNHRACELTRSCLCMDTLGIAERFGPASFDVVVALDVFLNKGEEPAFSSAEGGCSPTYCCLTPNGFVPPISVRGKSVAGSQIRMGGRRLWNARRRGTGMNGWKPLRGKAQQPRCVGADARCPTAASLIPLITNRPHTAIQRLAIRTQPGGGATAVGSQSE